MTMERMEAIGKYWRNVPPVAESVAAFLGIEAPKTGTLEDLMRELGMIDGFTIERVKHGPTPG